MKLILHGRKTGVKMSKLIKFLSTDFIYRMVNGFDFICLQENNTVTDTDRQKILWLLQSVSSGEQQSTSEEQECDELDGLFQGVGLSELNDPFDLEDNVDDDVREHGDCDSNSVDELVWQQF